MNNLTLIIPAKNEAESLPTVLNDLSNLNCNITVSLDKNDHATIDSIKKFNIDIYKQKELGYGNSLIEAINNCKTEYFCIFNADGSFEKDDLNEMLKLNYQNDFVFTSRYLKNAGSDDDTIVTYVGNKFFSTLGRILFSLKINDILYTYVMGKTQSFRMLNLKSGDFRFCVELPIKIQILGLKYASLASFEKKRLGGKKKVNAIKDGLLILLEMLRLFFICKILKKKN
mgnify:CR=1 FL=1|tara:strand:- start:843 stop:1526 length:684 start_codon:yes stop_codon:yes gene_type:complete